VLGQKVIYVDGVPSAAESVEVDGESALAS
jgi:hypothetical protein